MKHAGTFEDAMEQMMSDGDDEDMGMMTTTWVSGDDEMVWDYDMSSYST